MFRSARAIAVACLVLAGSSGASATTIPLAAPPIADDPASATIFEAMVAISRSSLIDPHRANRGVAPYNAALQSYAAGDFAGAQQTATSAIVAIAAPAAPVATSDSPVVSPVPPAQFPPMVDTRQSESEERLALARRALVDCGSPTIAPYTTAYPLYLDAVTNELGHHPGRLNGDVQSIVDDCAAAIPVVSPGTNTSVNAMPNASPTTKP
jgi:hypothetical protein